MQSSKINHQEQIQVVIRLKPTIEQQVHSKCVYMSNNEENELIVETPHKKEYFVFDNIADEECNQQQLYNKIGKEALAFSTQGYNCCIFAYGQTGAGKTYSILGKHNQLKNDIYSESRGILPRLLNELFQWTQQQPTKCSVVCSYMEIYNQQIFDLLNTQVKVRQIREDFKRGVFVEGLSQQSAKSYDSAMDILMKGLKNRKIAATSMNSQSSRSHTIFTINLQSEIRQGEILKYRKSKINIVDLAGSQRAKLTKVEGQRLKQGCNINKSLHVLGNVINALVESTKKKKHIPFRDSKLTYFLKDSLGGNSITKLLANIQPNKKYLADTLSTLMFAKRAKIIRMKVQINQKVTQNFQHLRKQIRQLRQQLAQAKFIKNQSKIFDKNSTDGDQQTLQNWDKIIDTSGFDLSKNEKIIQIFQQNQLNYKALIQIYQDHWENCPSTQNFQSRKPLNIHQEWKIVQKKNQVLLNLLRNFPAFTKIFKENMTLKNDYQKQDIKKIKGKKNLQFKQLDIITVRDPLKRQQNKISNQVISQIIQNYESILSQIQQKVTQKIISLQQQFNQLLKQNKDKDQLIKQLKKHRQLPPQLETLQNQNQYLKLNILQLQEQINNYQENQIKHQIQLKSNEQIYSKMSPQEVQYVLCNLKNIVKQAQEDIKQIQQQKQYTQKIIQQLKDQLIRVSNQNNKIIKDIQNYKHSNKQLKKKLNQLLKISSQSQIQQSNNFCTFWTNQQSNQDFIDKQLFDKVQQSSKIQIKFQKNKSINDLLKKIQQQSQKRSKIQQNIKIMQQNHFNQIQFLKKQLSKQSDQLNIYFQQIQAKKYSIKQLQQQFGKQFINIIQQYRQNVHKKLSQAKLTKKHIKNKQSLSNFYSPPLSYRKLQDSKQKSTISKNQNLQIQQIQNNKKIMAIKSTQLIKVKPKKIYIQKQKILQKQKIIIDKGKDIKIPKDQKNFFKNPKTNKK